MTLHNKLTISILVLVIVVLVGYIFFIQESHNTALLEWETQSQKYLNEGRSYKEQLNTKTNEIDDAVVKASEAAHVEGYDEGYADGLNDGKSSENKYVPMNQR